MTAGSDWAVWDGGRFGDRAVCVRADNPGPFTLDGTNTWVLREPGAARCVIVDPGPDLAEHVDAVLAEAGDVGLVLITHHHFDHTDAVELVRERTGAPVRAVSSEWCRDADPLGDDEEIDVDGLHLRAVHTPGHTADSVSFVLPAERVLLTGDMVLGRGTTIVAHPDGALRPYFASLEKMRSLVANGEVDAVWPAHGPVQPDAGGVLDYYLAHRRQRLDGVRAALGQLGVEAGPHLLEDEALPRRVVEIVYADVDESMWDAADWSVTAQLAYLATE
ncbi:MBL fold metallo-hydrolase [Nocardioides sp. R-C-SC26]|uniref:MBL fold metallo-hydrolase n=1 Tax=Nocardioides sp. R-C-SC26 TaxID=2870414 RepID=UPI001E4948FD|nr:MBL fold metallo-hydrolase [Nocardioides sp. R-C-SC26]